MGRVNRSANRPSTGTETAAKEKKPFASRQVSTLKTTHSDRQTKTSEEEKDRRRPHVSFASIRLQKPLYLCRYSPSFVFSSSTLLPTPPLYRSIAATECQTTHTHTFPATPLTHTDRKRVGVWPLFHFIFCLFVYQPFPELAQKEPKPWTDSRTMLTVSFTGFFIRLFLFDFLKKNKIQGWVRF